MKKLLGWVHRHYGRTEALNFLISRLKTTLSGLRLFAEAICVFVKLNIIIYNGNILYILKQAATWFGGTLGGDGGTTMLLLWQQMSAQCVLSLPSITEFQKRRHLVSMIKVKEKIG